ncbi:MAG: glycosyltransferase family 2 protein [Planktomarina sp.]
MGFKFQNIVCRAQSFDQVEVMGSFVKPIGAGRYEHFVTFASPLDGQIIGLRANDEAQIVRQVGFGQSGSITFENDKPKKAIFLVSGETIKIDSLPYDEDFFAGQNVGLAVQNLEQLNMVIDWLAYHVETQGMTAALILCRQYKKLGPDFVKRLKKRALRIKGLERLMLWSTDLPLGQSDMPSEAHPFTAAGAPGKDRMDPADPDPQTSPLGAFQVYDMLMHGYLSQARAVMNLDICDLVAPDTTPNVFDQTVQSHGGMIQLKGTQCFPWRLRQGLQAGFGDHIYQPFDRKDGPTRWCAAPQNSEVPNIHRLIRIGGRIPAAKTGAFYRFMALRHPGNATAKIVPKASLTLSETLQKLSRHYFRLDAVQMPDAQKNKMKQKKGTSIVTTMKNEGPFLLEWIAYHRAIGVDQFIVYTNDCTDGTDDFLELLQAKGIVQHRDNKFHDSGLKPQHHALREAEKEPVILDAEWVICMDVDEYITIKVGDGTLGALYDAVGDANMIALNWRLFGNADVHEFEDRPIIEQFTKCAHELTRKPHQAWGFKTLFRNNGIFKKLGVHRPKGLKPQFWDDIHWVNGSGAKIPKDMFRNAWRSNVDTYGYDLVQLNHYAVRSAESFLVKRDRGRVNHVDRDQGLAYWFRMNNNAEENHDIARMLPAFHAELARLMKDPDIAAAHAHSVQMHLDKIKELKATPKYSAFYETLTSDRQQRLSKMHKFFGSNVFLAGPDVIPDTIAMLDPSKDFFFTVPDSKTQH